MAALSYGGPSPTLNSGTFCIARSRSDDALLRYDHLKFSKMAAGRHLEFDPTGNGAVRSAVPENPTLEPNRKWIGRRIAEIWQFVIICNIWLSILLNVRICEYEYQTSLTDVIRLRVQATTLFIG